MAAARATSAVPNRFRFAYHRKLSIELGVVKSLEWHQIS
jgi:hypothetical protein